MILRDHAARDALREEIRDGLNWNPQGTSSQARRLADVYASMNEPRMPGAVIPVVHDDHLLFYAVADNPSDWRRLAPLLLAAVGVTLTDFDGRPVGAPGPVGDILRRHQLEVRGFSAPAGKTKQAGTAVDALGRLAVTLRTMPVALRELPRSAPQILHEFDLALQVGDRQASLTRLQELEERRAIDSLNLRFLSVRWHAAFREWQSLREKRWFRDLSQTRRPPHVTSELLRALYEVDVAGPLLGDPTTLLNRFRSMAATEIGTLCDSLPLSPSGPASIMLALDGVARDDERRLAALREVPTETWNSEEQSAFAEVLALRPVSPSVVSERSPREALVELQQRVDSGQRLTPAERIAIQELVARDGSLTLQQLVSTLIGAEPGQTPDLGPPVEESPAAVPDDWSTDTWSEWFEALPRLSPQAARQTAERLADEVSLIDCVPTPEARDRLASDIQEALATNEESAVLALPHLARWMQNEEGWPRADLGPLYKALLVSFLLFDSRTVDGFRSALSILDGWLSTGPDKSDYAEVIGEFRKALEGLSSVRTLDSLIDLAELLAVHPTQDAELRGELWAELQARVSGLQQWMTPSQVAILNGLCDVLGVPHALDIADRPSPETDAVARWRGTIGVYTLRPSIGQRVPDALMERIPGTQVTWNDDHVATERLRNLSERSGLMVVDWSAAKHSATDAIRKARREGDLVWVCGGASTIVTAVLDAVEKLQGRGS